MPSLAPWSPVVDLDGNPPDDVLNSRVHGMEEGRQGRELDRVGLLRLAFSQEPLVDREKLLKLLLLDGDLAPQVRPHAEARPSL